MNDHVFARAGMTATASLPEADVVLDRAVGYMKSAPKARWIPNTETLPYRGTSAGGGYSTVDDLLRFANAITDHVLLDAEHTDLLTTAKTEVPGGGSYCYGFGEDISNGVRSIGHGGGAPGMSGDLQICSSGYAIAVLSNFDPPAATRVSAFIRNRLPGKAL